MLSTRFPCKVTTLFDERLLGSRGSLCNWFLRKSLGKDDGPELLENPFVSVR